MAVSEERMQQDQIAAFARPHRGERAATGAHLLHLHCILLNRSIPWAV
jgi:hypothetical protein